MNPINTPSLQIGITNRCNLSCYMCRDALKDHGTDFLSQEMVYEDYIVAVNNLFGFKFSIVSLCWIGEPLLHDDFLRMFEYLVKKDKENNIFEILNFHTNGVLLDYNTASRILSAAEKSEKRFFIVFSVDAIKCETYQKIKKSDKMESVLQNISSFLEKRSESIASRRIGIAVQMIVLPENIDEAEEFYSYFKELFNKYDIEAELQFELDFLKNDSIVFSKANIPDIGLSERLFSRVKEIFGFKNNIESIDESKVCSYPFISAIITPEGNVLPCCRDTMSRLRMGNIFDENFKEIWFGESFKELRKAHSTFDLYKYPKCIICKNYNKLFKASENINKSDPELIDALERSFFHEPSLECAEILVNHYSLGNRIEKTVKVLSMLSETGEGIEKKEPLFLKLQAKAVEIRKNIDYLGDKLILNIQQRFLDLFNSKRFEDAVRLFDEISEYSYEELEEAYLLSLLNLERSETGIDYLLRNKRCSEFCKNKYMGLFYLKLNDKKNAEKCFVEMGRLSRNEDELKQSENYLIFTAG